MKAYFGTLIAAALVAALVGILSPEGARGGIGKFMRLLISLFLLCVIVAPLSDALQWLADCIEGEIALPGVSEDAEDDYQNKLDEALTASGAAYFTQMLTQTLESECDIPAGEVRCAVAWETDGGTASPSSVTVVLSGSAIWKDPHEVETFVTDLLGCPCQVAIE